MKEDIVFDPSDLEQFPIEDDKINLTVGEELKGTEDNVSEILDYKGVMYTGDTFKGETFDSSDSSYEYPWRYSNYGAFPDKTGELDFFKVSNSSIPEESYKDNRQEEFENDVFISSKILDERKLFLGNLYEFFHEILNEDLNYHDFRDKINIFLDNYISKEEGFAPYSDELVSFIHDIRGKIINFYSKKEVKSFHDEQMIIINNMKRKIKEKKYKEYYGG